MAWRVLSFVLVLVFGIAPGCAFHANVQPEPVTQPVSASTGTKKEQFGDLITGPGQRVSVSQSPPPLPPTTTIPQDPPTPIDPVSPPQAGSVELPKQPGPPSAAAGNENPEAIFPSIFPSQQGPDSPFLAAARAYERGRNEFASEQLRWFAPVNQAVLAKLLPAAARTAAGPIHDAKDAADLVNRIDSAAEVIRPFAELKIETIRLCDKVDDFGDYKPSVSQHAGKHVILYYEVENLVPEQQTTTGEVQYLTSFRAKIRIRGQGKSIELLSGTYRRPPTFRPVRDIYDAKLIVLPNQPGNYTIEIDLIDTTGRRASRTLEFRVEERK